MERQPPVQRRCRFGVAPLTLDHYSPDATGCQQQVIGTSPLVRSPFAYSIWAETFFEIIYSAKTGTRVDNRLQLRRARRWRHGCQRSAFSRPRLSPTSFTISASLTRAKRGKDQPRFSKSSITIEPA